MRAHGRRSGTPANVHGRWDGPTAHPTRLRAHPVPVAHLLRPMSPGAPTRPCSVSLPHRHAPLALAAPPLGATTGQHGWPLTSHGKTILQRLNPSLPTAGARARTRTPASQPSPSFSTPPMPASAAPPQCAPELIFDPLAPLVPSWL